MSPRRPHPFGRVASSIALRTRGSVAVAITAAVTTAVGVGVCTAAQAAGEPSFSIGVAAGPAGGRVDCVASFPCDRASSQFKLSGAWNFADRRIERVLGRREMKVQRPVYVGREAAASPATGQARVHMAQQARLVTTALGLG